MMSDGTKIEWTDATWNPITGCSVVSPGCTNCYAMKLAGTRMKNHPTRVGLTAESKAGPVWNGQVRFNEAALTQPLRWKRPRRIFVCAHGDLFHENVPDEWIDLVFAVMALAQHHTFQVLTKRSERMMHYLANRNTSLPSDPITNEAFALNHFVRGYRGMGGSAVWPLPNVWLGVSVEDQARADERIPDLLATPAAVRFVSMEPLLGPVDLTALNIGNDAVMDVLRPQTWASQVEEWRGTSDSWEDDFEDWFGRRPGEVSGLVHPALDWVIVGGESGRGARPMHPDWVRSIRDQCAAAGVPFFFKQVGEWSAVLDRDRDDPDWRADYSNDLAENEKTRWLNLAGGRGFHGERFHVMRRIGKNAAGRLLDGIEHIAMPEGRS